MSVVNIYHTHINHTVIRAVFIVVAYVAFKNISVVNTIINVIKNWPTNKPSIFVLLTIFICLVSKPASFARILPNKSGEYHNDHSITAAKDATSSVVITIRKMKENKALLSWVCFWGLFASRKRYYWFSLARRPIPNQPATTTATILTHIGTDRSPIVKGRAYITRNKCTTAANVRTIAPPIIEYMFIVL